MNERLIGLAYNMRLALNNMSEVYLNKYIHNERSDINYNKCDVEPNIHGGNIFTQ